MNRLALDVTLQTAAFLAVVAALILLPAGTVHFWQAWAWWAVFAVAVVVIDVYLWKRDPALLRRRMKAGAANETERAQKAIQSAAGALCLALMVVPGLDHRYGWSAVPPALSVAGDALVAAGFAVVLRVFAENTFTAAVVAVDAGQRVVTTGPYALVRHPMYSGAMLLFAGTPLALASWWAFVPAVLVALAVIARLLDEERVLAAKLPGYADYLRRTKHRLVPGVW